jgi:hypothetical protein
LILDVTATPRTRVSRYKLHLNVLNVPIKYIMLCSDCVHFLYEFIFSLHTELPLTHQGDYRVAQRKILYSELQSKL